MTEQERIERQNMLLHGTMERIEAKYRKAVRDGIENPAVVVFDLEDETARHHLRAQKEDVRRHVAEAKRRGVIPATVWHGSSGVAATLLDPDTPEADALREGMSIAGAFPVIVVGSGMTSLAMVPVPAS